MPNKKLYELPAGTIIKVDNVPVTLAKDTPVLADPNTLMFTRFAEVKEREWKEPVQISISEGKAALFEGNFYVVQDFRDFTNETQVIRELTEWARAHGYQGDIEVITPQVTAYRRSR